MNEPEMVSVVKSEGCFKGGEKWKREEVETRDVNNDFKKFIKRKDGSSQGTWDLRDIFKIGNSWLTLNVNGDNPEEQDKVQMLEKMGRQEGK